MKPLSDCRLYAFVDSAYLHGREPAALARSLCEGGTDIIQFRAKDWPAERIEQTARAILPITRAHGVPLVINDHFTIAQRVGAEFCHLGQEDFFDAGLKHSRDLPKLPDCTQPALGLSTHAPDQAHRALEADPAYIAIGPVFPTGTKPGAKAVTLDYVRWAAENVSIPWFAIGGINLQNLDQILAAGATRICVVSAILNDSDPAGACRALTSRLRP